MCLKISKLPGVIGESLIHVLHQNRSPRFAVPATLNCCNEQVEAEKKELEDSQVSLPAPPGICFLSNVNK